MKNRVPVLKVGAGVFGLLALLYIIYVMYPENDLISEKDPDGWSSETLHWKNQLNQAQLKDVPKESDHHKPVLKDNYLHNPGTVLQDNHQPTTRLPPQPFHSDIKPNVKLLDYFQIDKNEGKILKDEVTIVTMYFNIGEFQKGEANDFFGPKLYERWTKVFASLENPVVAFFDTPQDKQYFQNLRARFGPDKTRAFLVNRDQFWGFGLQDRISEIFAEKGYPKHHPNTVVPEYSSAMHCKYEIMIAASRENFFNTSYIAWLDIGLFRSEAMNPDLPFFELWLPPDFNSSTVAYTEVFPRDPRLSPRSIIYRNAVWLCGCFFIGQVSTMIKWSEQYMRATEALMDNHDLMSTDQQILYILYNFGHPKTKVQTYISYNNWFHLGYLCKEEGDKRRQKLRMQSSRNS